MELGRPFAVITPTVDGDVLGVLAHADKPFTPGEVQRLGGAWSESGIRKALSRLAEQGIVRAEKVGPVTAYRLNRDHLAAGPLIELADLRRTFITRLRSKIASWQVTAPFAALFGSAARGGMRPTSDIDVFVVRPDDALLSDADDAADDDAGTLAATWGAQVSSLQHDASAWTGNDVRVLEMSRSEVRSGLEAGEQVLDDIRRDGIVLVGDHTFWRL